MGPRVKGRGPDSGFPWKWTWGIAEWLLIAAQRKPRLLLAERDSKSGMAVHMARVWFEIEVI